MIKNIEKGLLRICLVIYLIWTILVGIIFYNQLINECILSLGIFKSFSICFKALWWWGFWMVIPLILFFLLAYIWKGFFEKD